MGPMLNKEYDVAELLAPEDRTEQVSYEDITVVDVKQHARLRPFRRERLLRRLAFVAAILLGALMIPAAGLVAWRFLGQGVPLPEWVVVVSCVAVGIGATIVVRWATAGR